MGMDCNSYIIVRRPTAQDLALYEEHPFDDLPEQNGVRVRTLSLTREALHKLNETLGCELPGKLRQFLNTEKLEADFEVPKRYNIDFGVGEMEGEMGWVVYRSPREEDEPLRLDFECARYLYTDGLFHVDVVLQNAGYMRKPFRRTTGEEPTLEEDGTLVLSSDDFAGADETALRALLGEEAMGHYSKILLPSDMQLAESLQTHTACPEAWGKAVVNVLRNPLGLVVLDW